ncbi:MAG: response regulator transcription factor [Chloroflexota bacterium]
MNILICDDQALIRDSLTHLLGIEDDITVIGVVGNGEDAVDVALRDKPDIILMDLKMPKTNGIQATRRIREYNRSIRILALTTFSDDTWILDAIRAGADGYILKDSPRDNLLEAIRCTYAGKNYLDPSIAGILIKNMHTVRSAEEIDLAAAITQRERSILSALAKGYTNRDIAARLEISEGTVRNYVASLITKLQLEDRTQVAIFAVQNGFGRGA